MMNFREQQLKERDVRRTAPELDPVTFLDAYVASNFPQTAAFKSDEQRADGIVPQSETAGVNYKKKPLSGTSFDNPAGS
jgi:hypothetical protein